MTAVLAAPHMPPRVQEILARYLDVIASRLVIPLGATLDDVQRHLIRQASNEKDAGLQNRHIAEARELDRSRDAILAEMTTKLATELAGIRQAPASGAEARRLDHLHMDLVDYEEVERDLLLEEISRRRSIQTRQGLFLLGQRFGVLAGAPAFDAEHIPGGANSLCRAVDGTLAARRISLGTRLRLLHSFEQLALSRYGEWLDALNQLLNDAGVLPGLALRPYLGRGHRPATGPQPASPPSRPFTAWPGQAAPTPWAAPAATAAGGAASFADLQKLLDKPAAPAAAPALSVRDAITALQQLPIASAHVPALDLLERLQAQLQQTRGADAALPPAQADSLKLLDRLYANLTEEVQADSPAMQLLARLQTPVAANVLHGSEFFLDAQHPARELLNTAAESGAIWMNGEDADPHLLQKLQQAVEQVASHWQDASVLARVHEEVQNDFRAAAHRAELAERRQVEAARGRDRMEAAKLKAGRVIDAALAGTAPSRFVQTLIHQAWADVLTLTLLRNGEDSDEWRQAEQATARLVTGGYAGDAAMAAQLQQALIQVGHHPGEAHAIAAHLTGTADALETSQTELIFRLKQRARLGEKVAQAKPKLPPRNAVEEQCHARLLALPPGSWLEFADAGNGKPSRLRLSWFSEATGNALLVNQRGQRAAEHTLDELARLLAAGKVQIVSEELGRPVERAWKRLLDTLQAARQEART